MQGPDCPRCHEPVRIPDVDAETLVRCPWCGEEFRCGDASGGQPPMLIVVSPELEQAGNFQDVESYGFAPAELSQQPGGWDPEPHRWSPTDSSESGESHERSPTRSLRSRKKRENPVVSVLKVFGGGAAGILIALFILQAFGRLPDMGVWPFRGPNSAFFGSSRSVRAMPPSRNEAERRARREDSQGRRGEGRMLPIPALPEFELDADPNPSPMTLAGDETASLESSIEACEDALAAYRELAAAVDVAGSDDSNASQPPKTAKNLIQEFATAMDDVAQLVVRQTQLTPTQHALLDSLVIGFSSDEAFLRQTVTEMMQRYPAIEDQGAVSVAFWLMGKVEKNDAQWKMLLPGPGGRSRDLDLADRASSIEPGNVVFVIGSRQTPADTAPAQVFYARQLQRD